MVSPPAQLSVSSSVGRPKLQGPLAVKSKAVKPGSLPSHQSAKQGLVTAIQSRLQDSAPAGRSLVDLVADQPPAMATANPQMPPESHADPPSQPSGSTPAITTEINLKAVEDTERVDSNIVYMAEQRAMHAVYRYQVLSVMADEAVQVGPAARSAEPVRIYSTEERRLHTTCLETAENVLRSFQLLMTYLNDVRYLLRTLKDPFQCFPMFVDCV